MSVSGVASRPRRKKTRSTQKQDNAPHFNSTADFFFSLLMMMLSPLILLMKWFIDKIRAKVKKKNVSLIDPRADNIILKLDKTVSGSVYFISQSLSVVSHYYSNFAFLVDT